jgi:hypothetical protein
MQAVKGVAIEKGIKESGAADIADDCHLVSLEFEDLQGLIEAAHHRFMATAGTKYRRSLPVQQTGHDHTFSTIFAGLINSPFIRP